jgi:hypothetical protein
VSKGGADKDSTLAALLREKPKRGRPRREVSRESVYIELSEEQKERMSEMAGQLPEAFARADIADLAIMVLAARLEALRRAVAGRTREIPEGITDLGSLYLLWDLPSPEDEGEARWTSVRVSPQQAIDLGRAHGTLNVLFGATRSEVFGLGLSLLGQFIEHDLIDDDIVSLLEMKECITDLYL